MGTSGWKKGLDYAVRQTETKTHAFNSGNLMSVECRKLSREELTYRSTL